MLSYILNSYKVPLFVSNLPLKTFDPNLYEDITEACKMLSPEIYKGNCHCGQIRFDLHLQQPLQQVFSCRCSICTKKGYLWIFPEESQFQITSGHQAMARYTANGRSGDHFVSTYFFSFIFIAKLTLSSFALCVVQESWRRIIWYRPENQVLLSMSVTVTRSVKSMIFESDHL